MRFFENLIYFVKKYGSIIVSVLCAFCLFLVVEGIIKHGIKEILVFLCLTAVGFAMLYSFRWKIKSDIKWFGRNMAVVLHGIGILANLAFYAAMIVFRYGFNGEYLENWFLYIYAIVCIDIVYSTSLL